MTTIFISFPPVSGGNHLRNLIAVGSNFLDNNSYNESIKSQYFQNETRFVHGNDYGSTAVAGNFTKLKLHQALLNPSKNFLFFGHFGELMSSRNDIKKIHDKKIILLSINTSECRSLWINRLKLFNKEITCEYFLGEQIFLYESFIYQDCFKVNPQHIMNISIHELFSTNIVPVISRLEFFLQSKFNIHDCQELHSAWVKKNNII